MWISQSAAPCRALQAYVRAYGQRQFDGAPDTLQPYVACLEPTLSLDFCDPTHVEFSLGKRQAAPKLALVGPHTSHQGNVWLEGRMNSFGIFFQPLGCWQLFRVPYSLLVNRFYGADEVLGGGVRQLWQQMGECKAFEDRVILVEEFLLQRATKVSDCTPVMRSAIRSFQSHGTLQVGSLAHDTALSVRQFERNFLRDVGVRPKLFARIARCQKALDSKLIAPQRSWLHIAHYFGYHDQMHMIRDFQDLNGATPSDIALQLIDLRPGALAAAEFDEATVQH